MLKDTVILVTRAGMGSGEPALKVVAI